MCVVYGILKMTITLSKLREFKRTLLVLWKSLSFTFYGMHVQEHSLLKRFAVRHYCNPLSLFASYIPCRIDIGSV